MKLSTIVLFLLVTIAFADERRDDRRIRDNSQRFREGNENRRFESRDERDSRDRRRDIRSKENEFEGNDSFDWIQPLKYISTTVLIGQVIWNLANNKKGAYFDGGNPFVNPISASLSVF